MRVKKLLSLLLTATMLLTLVACTGQDQSQSSVGSTSVSKEGTSQASEGNGEKVTVKLSYPVLAVVPTEEGTVAVEEEINKYLDSIGETFHVDLDPIDGNNYANTVDMTLLGNTSMDVFCPFSGLGNAINENKVIALNDYLDNELAGAVEVMGEEYLTSSTVDGNVYAIPCYKGQVLIDYWCVRRDIFDQAGLDPNATYDLEAINDALAKMQETCPDIPAIGARLGVQDGNTLMIEELLGGAGNYEYTLLTGGPVVFGDSTTLENYYESEMFEEVVRTAYAWNQAGYVPVDSSIETEDASSLVNADRALSYFITFGYDRDTVENPPNPDPEDYPIYAIPVAEQVFTSNFIYWSIAHSSEHPAEAARLLNMLYTDETVLNLVIFGIEGVSYEVLDDTGIVDSIGWPEGQTMETVPYTAALSCGILGNQFIMSAMEGSTKVSDVEFMEEKMENAVRSPLFGFSFDTAPVSSEISAISNVTGQYLPGLRCGEMDPDTFLPKFQEELKTAGIDAVIAEAQSQVDAWLSENK